MEVETITKPQPDASPSAETNENKGEPPSGFILKLYQMVTGAPDDVITWNEAGDAFIIKSDIKRLEEETLPQYFRHNRFQSLVRQLNFYSFRKINRERNVWIYKHDLFSRDNPETLHLVRRRTCLGNDGRKQRSAARKKKQLLKENEASKSDDDSYTEEEQDSIAPEVSKKRTSPSFVRPNPPPSKRPVEETRTPTPPPPPPKIETPQDDVIVDTSMLESKSSSVSEASEDQRSAARVDEKTEMVEQSIVVSMVASQLAQYARKASYGQSSKREGRSGVVTPPYSGSLLTYDDEILDEPYHELAMDNHSPTVKKRKPSLVEPDLDISASKAGDIAQRIIATGVDCGFSLHTAANVARFCMLHTPYTEDIASKIQSLLALSPLLAAEFEGYHAALTPSLTGNRFANPVNWNQEVSCVDAVREFTIFAVNTLNVVVQKIGHSVPLRMDDLSILQAVADTWQKCARLR